MPVEMGSWSKVQFVYRFYKLLNTLPRGSNFHYPLNCLWPLHFCRGDKVTMSVADCTAVPGPFADHHTGVWAWFSFFFVTRVDVLSPNIFSAMSRYFIAKRMSLTPGGTFLVPPPHPTSSQRLPKVVFLSRLIPGKGVDDFLDIVPDLWMLLRGRVSLGFSFQIAGYGSLQDHVSIRVGKLARLGIPISFIGYAVAEPLLARAAVALSMQEVTNYPSRVVGEALLAGCAVIVRDTGDSHEFGDDLPGLVYCHKKLEAREVAEKIKMLLDSCMLDLEFPDKVRAAALDRFSSKHYIEYYYGIIFAK